MLCCVGAEYLSYKIEIITSFRQEFLLQYLYCYAVLELNIYHTKRNYYIMSSGISFTILILLCCVGAEYLSYKIEIITSFRQEFLLQYLYCYAVLELNIYHTKRNYYIISSGISFTILILLCCVGAEYLSYKIEIITSFRQEFLLQYLYCYAVLELNIYHTKLK